MDMVAHQAVSVEAESTAFQMLAKQLQIPYMVSIVQENFLPLVPTGDDVVKGALKFEPRFSHTRNYNTISK
jgi:hypothetical protein